MQLLAAGCSLFVATSINHAMAATSPSSLATDTAYVADRACYAAASGTIPLQSHDLATEMRNVERLGLIYGVPNGVIDTLDRFSQTMLNRATLASKVSGDHQIIMAAGGIMQNCRVLVTGKADSNLADAIAVALVGTKGNAWTLIPAMNQTRSGLFGRTFIRRDRANRPYRLDALSVIDPSRRLRMMLLVSAWPAETPIPAGL